MGVFGRKLEGSHSPLGVIGITCTHIMNLSGHGAGIPPMGVPVWPIRTAGSWGYLAGSWREATPHCVTILENVRENVTKLLK